METRNFLMSFRIRASEGSLVFEETETARYPVSVCIERNGALSRVWLTKDQWSEVVHSIYYKLRLPPLDASLDVEKEENKA